MTFTATQWSQVATLLGREPRGLEAIPVMDGDGHPRVIRVASLVDGKPFPTLFWLVDAALNPGQCRPPTAGVHARRPRGPYPAAGQLSGGG